MEKNFVAQPYFRKQILQCCSLGETVKVYIPNMTNFYYAIANFENVCSRRNLRWHIILDYLLMTILVISVIQ